MSSARSRRSKPSWKRATERLTLASLMVAVLTTAMGGTVVLESGPGPLGLCPVRGVAEINQETKVWLVNPGPHPIEVSEGQVPIPKGKKSVDKSQWRPTTLLPMPSKIVERIVHSQFMRFLIDNEILSECQFVFCKNR